MPSDNRKKLGKVIARAWVDKEFLARLRRDPQTVLAEAGVRMTGTVHIHEDSDTDYHFVLPKRPTALDEHVRKQKERAGSCSADPQLCSTVMPDFCSTDKLCDAERVAPQFCSGN
jgi:hypothetical protein